MRGLILAGGLAAACSSPIEVRTINVAPGRPAISMNSQWIQDQPTRVWFEWPNIESCNFDEWFCETPPGITTTVLGVTCHGCTLLEDPTGTTASSQARFSLTAVAITDDEISVEVQLRFDATRSEYTLSSSAQGDHEVALDVLCKTIDVAELRHDGTPVSGLIDGARLRRCGATRLANEIVVAFPRVRTFHDYLSFPFCLPGWACRGSWEEEMRPIEQLRIDPAPVDWWQLQYSSAGDLMFFAELPANVRGSVEFRTRLLGGVDATTSLEVPRVASDGAR